MEESMRNLVCRCISAILAIALFFCTPQELDIVHAEGLDVRSAISSIFADRVNQNYHYSYDGGKYFDTLLTSDDPEEIYKIGLDCTSGTLAILSKAIRNAGGDPYRYFGECRNYLNNEYPFELAQHFTNMEKIADTIHDSSILLPGDILVYGKNGEKGHMNVYCGNNETFDIGSNGNGAVGNYRGFAKYVTFKDAATSTTGSYALQAVYRLKMHRNVQYSVIKKSTDEMISNSPQYSLASAVFGVYTSEDCNENSRIDTLTTDSSGYAHGESSVEYGVDRLFVKELSAPVNFMISDTTIHTILLQEGNGQTEFFDTPMYITSGIEITKIDKEGKKDAADMSEAQFTFTFYDTFQDISNTAPIASWTLKTMKEYKDDGVTYVAKMDDAHLVAGNFIRNFNNEAVLPLGTLVVEETKAATNYTIEGGFLEGDVRVSSEERMVIQICNEDGKLHMYAGNHLSQGSYEKEEISIRGSYELYKLDRNVLEVGRAQGDASFANAEFDLYYLGDGSDASMMIDHDGDGLGDGKEYTPSEEFAIDHITLDVNGYYSTPNETYLSYGNYRLIETKAPVGYSLLDETTDRPITIDFSITENKKRITVQAIETVYQTDVQIMKTKNTSQSSSFTQPEVGAVFDIVLKKYVEEEAHGQPITRDLVLQAFHKAQEKGYTSMEYAQIITGDDGIGKSGPLAYGKYCLVQESSIPELEIIQEVKEFSIDTEHQPTISFTATNQLEGYILKLFKKDADTGKNVTMTSSAFKIRMLFDHEGKDVSHSTTDLSLSSRLVDGYVEQTIGDRDEKSVYNTFMTASRMQALNSSQLEEGVFYGTSNSKEDTSNSCTVLPLQLVPGTYQLEEVITADGYITGEPITFVIHADTISRVNEAKQNVIEVVFENHRLVGNIAFKKEILRYADADVTYIEDDLEKFGFTLFAAEDIYASDDGKLIVKKDEPAKKLSYVQEEAYEEIGEIHPESSGNFTIQDIPLGNYYLKETTIPDGIVKGDKIWIVTVKQTMFDHFIEKQTKYPLGLGEEIDRHVTKDDVETTCEGVVENQHVIRNHVTKVQISKKTITGNDELEGATLHLYGNGVDLTWISSQKPYTIEGLAEGVYKLEEMHAPDGYYYHEEITFTVENSGEIQVIEMKDAPIEYEIRKVDEENNLVKGVKLQLFDVTDQKEIPLENNGVTMERPFKLSQVLSVDHQYELREIQGKEGYYKSSCVTFEVPKYNKGVISIAMLDMRTGVHVQKVDQYGESVVGAELEILKAIQQEDGTVIAQEGEVVYTFTTKQESEDISDYVEGTNTEAEQWYILREKQTPFGYERMDDMSFCVTGTKDVVQMIQATDIRKDVCIKVVKVDASNSTLKDAEFSLSDIEGKVINDVYGKPCYGRTQEDGTLTFVIPYVETCYLKELCAPSGYSLLEENVEIHPSSEEDFEKPITLWIENSPESIVNTSDTANVFRNCSVFVISFIGGICFMKMRRIH